MDDAKTKFAREVSAGMICYPSTNFEIERLVEKGWDAAIKHTRHEGQAEREKLVRFANRFADWMNETNSPLTFEQCIDEFLAQEKQNAKS